MAEVFVSLKEAAELESISYEAIRKRVKRAEYKVRADEVDGQQRIFVSVSSLSSQARRKYKKSIQVDVEEMFENEKKTPWYVGYDLNFYIENHKEEYYKAIEVANKIRAYLDESKHGSKSEDMQDALRELGISKRTFQRYVQDYITASAWAMKIEQYSNTNYDFFKVLALCRKPRESNTFPSLSDKARAYIENIWFHKAFAQNRGTVEMLYSKLTELSEAEEFEIPSYMTVWRYIQHLMENERGKNARFLAEKGLREYKNKIMVKASRASGALQVLEMVQGDEHTFDCWVEYTASNGKKIPIRPRLVAWIDMRSRAILGDVICRNANSQILKQSVYKMVYDEERGGVPKYLYIDNGKDYTAKEMTGRHRNERTSNFSFDSEIKGFYKSLGIVDDHRSMPYEPWTKGNIERFFGSVEEDFTRWMTSYTGTLTGSKTAAKVKKDIKKLQEQGKLLTMEEFYQHWSKWLKEQYHNAEHSGLKKQKEKWITPLSLFQNAEERYFKAAPPRSYASMLMMKAERVHVYNIGIKRFGHEYRADELVDYINDKVDIRYDVNDVTTIYVYNREGEFICEAKSQELLQIAPSISQKVLEEHIKMQKEQIKRDRERLNEYRMPLEERLATHEAATSEVIGLGDMMTEGKGKAEKIVALPADKQYREQLQNKAKKQETSDYLQKKADSVLKQLREMG